MLYDDRKMIKWQGFMLSEHAEQIKKGKIEKETATADEQTKELFDRRIYISYHSQLPIRVSLNTFGEAYIQIAGVVQSLHRESGYLYLKGKGRLAIEDIVSVEFANHEDEGHGN